MGSSLIGYQILPYQYSKVNFTVVTAAYCTFLSDLAKKSYLNKEPGHMKSPKFRHLHVQEVSEFSL